MVAFDKSPSSLVAGEAAVGFAACARLSSSISPGGTDWPQDTEHTAIKDKPQMTIPNGLTITAIRFLLNQEAPTV
jgi:hypothetical protein